MEKFAWNGPKRDQDDFFLLIQTLPTFWIERIRILRILSFLDSEFPDFQICKFPEIWPGRGLGRAVLGRAGLGLGLGRVGPSGGPGRHIHHLV